MAQLFDTFDLADMPQSTSGSYDPLPPGWYTATITGAEIKSTKDGSGEYIKVRYDITGPSHQGRVVFGNVNLKNASAKAEEIGRAQLGEIMRATGVARLTDTDQLVGNALSIKLTIKAATEQYEASNEVKGFKAISGGSVPQARSRPSLSSAQASSAPPAPAGGSAKAAPPWAKR